MNKVVKDTFNALKTGTCWDIETTSWDSETLDQAMDFAEKAKTLLELLAACDDVETYKRVTYEELMKMKYDLAHTIILKCSIMKRMELLEKLTFHRAHLYERTKYYADGQGYTKDEMISSAQYQTILGQIKHVEVIQTWLYGVEIGRC